MPHGVRADLKAAQTALGAGDFVAALKEVQPVWQTHPLDAALITARSTLELGRPDLAEKAARDALTMKPDSYAALLLLGSALQRQDKVIAAEYYFRRALDVSEDARAKELSRNVLRSLQRQKNWLVDGTFGIVPTSNVGKVSDEKKVKTVLGEFDITSQSERVLGIYGGLYLTRQTPLANGARFDFGVNFYDKAFRQHEFNMKTRGATASFNFPLSERSNASFSASKSRFSFGGEPYSDTTKLGASYGFSTAAGRILRFEMTHEEQDIIDDADQLSYENSGSVNFGVWRSKQTYVSLELRGNRRTSEHPAFDSWGKGASVLARYNRRDTSWVIEGALSRNQKIWDRPSGITPDVRQDNERLLSMSTYNSNFSFLGVTPTFRYTYQNRKSTIPIYSVLSHDVFVGVTNAF